MNSMALITLMATMALIDVNGLIADILPHSAPSWILSKAENLASSSLQDGATKWYYFL